MRGIPSLTADIRKKVFTEVARVAYEGGDDSRPEGLRNCCKFCTICRFFSRNSFRYWRY